MKPSRAVPLSVLVLLLLAMAVLPGARSNAAQDDDPNADLAFVYSQTLGETEVPWYRSAAQLNQPWGVAAAGDNFWIADSAGRRAIQFSSSGRYMDEIGRAGLGHAIHGGTMRFIADVATFGAEAPGGGGNAGPTPTPTKSGGPGIRPLATASVGSLLSSFPSASISAEIDQNSSSLLAANPMGLHQDQDPNPIVWLVDSGSHHAVGIDRVTGQKWVLGEPDAAGNDDEHLDSPSGIAAGPDRRVYVSDTGNHRVQIFDEEGTLIGSIGQNGSPGAGPDQFSSPARLAIDREGLLYVADTGNNRVVSYDVSNPSAPAVQRQYGDGSAGNGDNQLNTPLGVTTDASFVYVADSANCRVQIFRRREAELWRSVEGCGGDVPAMLYPTDVAYDARGFVTIADPFTMQVYQLNPDWSYLRAFGSTDLPYLTDEAHYNAPVGLAFGPDDSLIVAERDGNRLIKRLADGSVDWTYGQPGISNNAQGNLDRPADVGVDSGGRIFVADEVNDRIERLGADGLHQAYIATDGQGPGEVDCPSGIGVAPDDRLAVAERCNHRVQILDGDGMALGSVGSVGQAGAADDQLDHPEDAAIDARGWLYVADTGNHRVQVFDDARQHVRTMGVSGQAGDDFGHLDSPNRLALDADGRLYVSDEGNQRIQVFDPDGAFLTTIAGRRGKRSGEFREPHGLAIASNGRLHVADTENHRLQVFDLAVEPWTARNINGFGDRAMEGVASLLEMDGSLIAGSYAPDLGLSIRKRDGGDQPWTTVLSAGDGDIDNVAVAEFYRYGGKAYAGIVNEHVELRPDGRARPATSNGGAIWRSDDGSSWTPVAQDGLGDARNAGFTAMIDYEGMLYAGTRSITNTQGAEIWRSTSGDAGSWARAAQAGFDGDLANEAIGAMGVFTDTLWAGTCQASGAPEIWQSKDGLRWSAGGPGANPAIGRTNNGCVSSMLGFGEHFYVALASDARMGVGGRAGEIWRCKRCDTQDWEQVAPGGIGNGNSRGRIALYAYNEPPFTFLYAFAGNSNTGIEVWRATDGLTWEQVRIGGFGDSNNFDLFGGRSLAVADGRLHVGTLNRVQGGELWSTGGSRPGTLPTPSGPRPTATPRPRPAPPDGRAAYELVDQWPPGRVIAPDVVGNIRELAVLADGTVYLLDESNNRVMSVAPDGSWGLPFGNIGRGPDRIGQVGAMAVDANADQIYVSDLASERLLVFKSDATFVNAWQEIYATGIEVQPDGTLWVADRMAGAVRHLAADGTELGRFGSFGDRDEDQFQALDDVTVDSLGNLHVLDLGGDRIRMFRPEGASYRRFRTIDLTAQRWQGCGLAQPRRITALGPERLLADGCVINENQREDVFPNDHRSSDLYRVYRRTANAGAGHYVALATYDTDRFSGDNPVYPAVVRYFDAGFDIVQRYTLGRVLDAATAAADGAIDASVRLSTAPDGSLMLTDGYGLRQRAADGALLDELPLAAYPSRLYPLQMFPEFTVGEGDGSRVMGVGQLRGRMMVIYGNTVYRRYCRARQCSVNPYVDVIWDTTLPTLTEGVAAVAHEVVGDQFVVLNRYRTAPASRGVEAISARLLVYPLGQMGRKTEIVLQGEDREAIWADVDAGPTGRIYVLDTLNDRVQVYASDLTDLGMVPTPKDAWRVAGGPNNEIYVLTVYGHVVRMAEDGTVLSRFIGRPHQGVPPTSLVDLAVDGDGWVYTVDELADQVTVFAPEGTEDDILLGGNCSVSGDKWVDPRDVLLGNTTKLYLTLFGTCGFVEQPADIVLAVNTLGRTLGNDPGRQLANNLRRARQIAALTDLDRHRVGVVSFSLSGQVDQDLTSTSYELVRALRSVTADRGQPRNYSALRSAMDVFEDPPPPERMQVIVIITPGSDDDAGIAFAESLKAQGIKIVVVNGGSVIATSDLFNDIDVDPRAMGAGKEVHRRMIGRFRPEVIVKSGTLTDVLPENIEYVPGSANPPATYDAAARSLTWNLLNLDLDLTHTFTLDIRPEEEGEWPTNIEAKADVIDGWDAAAEVLYPVPKVRVYGELPTPTPTATNTPTATPTPTQTPIPKPIFLPLLLKTECSKETRNADIALIIDTSGSMGDPTSPGGPIKLEAARESARAFLSNLVAGRDQAALIQFNFEAQVLVGLTDDPAIAIAGLDNLNQANGTRIDLALEAGLAVLTGPERRADNNAVLILLTDGEPTGTTREEVVAAAEAAKSAGLLVYTIGLGSGVDQGLLREIAGKPEWFFFAPETSDLEVIYDQIAFSLPCKPGWP